MNGSAGFAALIMALAFSLSAWAQYAPPSDVEGIPFPESEAVYHQPVGRPAPIMSDNDDPARRKNPATRHAWDYGLDLGSPVVAARSGVVTGVEDHHSIGGTDPARYQRLANTIVIDHLDGSCAKYCNLAPGTARVRRGEFVMQGEWIASSGDTGQAQYGKLLFVTAHSDSEESMAVSFEDFKKNGGIPVRGDRVPKAGPPAVPQDCIDAYKRIWRACEQADMVGHSETAWTFSLERPRKPAPDYFYHKVLMAREKVLRERLLDRLKILAAVTEPDEKEGYETVLLLEALGKAKVQQIKNPLFDLKAAAQNWSNETWEAWKKEAKAIRLGVEGLRLECLGEREKGLERYSSALQRSRGPNRAKARKDLVRLAGSFRTEFREGFSRYETEWEIATIHHRKRIEEGAAALWERTRKVMEKKLKSLPDEKAKIQADLKAMEKRYTDLVRKK